MTLLQFKQKICKCLKLEESQVRLWRHESSWSSTRNYIVDNLTKNIAKQTPVEV